MDFLPTKPMLLPKPGAHDVRRATKKIAHPKARAPCGFAVARLRIVRPLAGHARAVDLAAFEVSADLRDLRVYVDFVALARHKTCKAPGDLGTDHHPMAFDGPLTSVRP